MNPVIQAYLHEINRYYHRAAHIVSVSGGKDSTATYLLALERGQPFRAVFADTGHENPITYDFVRSLAERTGGPRVEFVTANFRHQIATRRAALRDRWRKDGVPEEKIDRALAALRATGNPFLDMCLLKGRFPSTRVRFCTEEPEDVDEGLSCSSQYGLCE